MRASLSRILAALAGVAILIAIPLAYIDAQVLERDRLADRLAIAAQSAEVREIVSERIVDGLADAGVSEVIAVRPLALEAVSAFLRTPPAGDLARAVARDAHGVLIEGRGESLVVDLGRGGVLIVDALDSVSPQLASRIPEDFDAELVTFDKGLAAYAITDEAANLRDAVPWSLALAALLAIASVAVAPDRRRALARLGIATTAAGGALLAVLVIGRALTVSEVDDALGAGAPEAAGALWNALLGDLRAWGVTTIVAGLALATAATAEPDRRGALDRVLGALREPPSRPLRAGRGLALVTLAVALALAPGATLAIVAVVAACGLLVTGLTDLADAVTTTRPRRVLGGHGIAGPVAAAGAAAVLIVASIAVASLIGGRDAPEQLRAAEAPPAGCNGSAQNCAKRLNEITLPGTHNSFSASSEPGWLFANQRYGIRRQLDDGIRLLSLDVHIGAEASSGLVRTDLEAEGTDRNRVAKALGPEAVRVAERLAGRLGAGPPAGPRGLYLCHTLCELGSEPALDQLELIGEWLDEHPSEVVMVILESYVPPDRLERLFADAGLLDRTARLERSAPLPTLGELVRSKRRVVVMIEGPTGGRPWLADAFSFAQDTPLGARSAGQLSCSPSRGDADSPLLMINHWIDAFPPDAARNGAIGGQFLRKRLRRCERERARLPNLVLVDFYERSGVVDAARGLGSR